MCANVLNTVLGRFVEVVVTLHLLETIKLIQLLAYVDYGLIGIVSWQMSTSEQRLHRSYVKSVLALLNIYFAESLV